MTATPDDIVTSRTRDVQPTVFSEPWPSDVLPWSEDDVTTAPTDQLRHERHTENFTASSARGRPRVRLVRNVDPAQQRSALLWTAIPHPALWQPSAPAVMLDSWRPVWFSFSIGNPA